MSSSVPNGFNFHGEDSMNLHGAVPFPMDSTFRNHESNMVQSMFMTSNHTNRHGLFSSSPSINRYQNSHLSSSSFGFNNPLAGYQMRNNMVSNVVDYSPINNNPHLSQVSITQTITNRYSAIVPTSSLVTSQNDYGRAINPSILNPSFYSPSFVDKQQPFYSPNFVDKQREILNPAPLSTVPPYQNSVFPRHVDPFPFPPKHRSDQHVPYRRPVKKRSKPTKFFDENFNNFDSEEDGEYDGRTHSLPYEKYGPYTCPKCESVFDTSQKFAAHISSVHYKNESIQERAKRYKAKNKRKLHKLNQMMNEESEEIQPENRVVEEIGGNNNIASDTEAFKQLVVKEEPSYDFV